MIRIIFAAALAAAVWRAGAADLAADYEAGERSAELITPEVRAAAGALMGEANAEAFLHAMRLNMTKYDLDMQTQAGRRAWHGQLIGEIVDTEARVKVEIYSNRVSGAVWRYRLPFQPREPKAPGRVTYATTGLPSRLAAARAARAAEVNAGAVVTNVTIIGNAPRAAGAGR